MGLTVAEAFMLVAFVLLMLLLFWRHQVQDEVDLVDKISDRDKQMIQDGFVLAPPPLFPLIQMIEKQPPEGLDILLGPDGIGAIERIAGGDTVIPPEELEGLKKRAGLASTLSEEQWKRILDGAELVQPEQVTELQGYRQSGSLEEVAEAVELRGILDPDGEDSNEELVDRIEELMKRERAVDSQLAEDAAARGEFIENLKRELAADVEKAGGRIDPFGRVIFPETVVFETGSAVIPPGFMAVLDDICPRWLAELRKSADRFDIDEIRIEGHSSPEWASAQTERDAWVANLGLSQRRAQSVLAHCLDLAAGTPLGEWARGKLTAVGYSSSRPVKVDGREDPGASRRVMLGYEFSRDRLIADLGDAGRMEAGSGAVRPIAGKALVIDADTIKVGEAATRVRLDGIDAPELKQHCVAADGSEWACGRKARLALQQHIAGRNVVCERLRPGLMRLRGVCRIEGEEAEVNRWVVEAGWAFAFVKSSRAYAGHEAAARAARRGIWSGREPMPPWEWRGPMKR